MSEFQKQIINTVLNQLQDLYAVRPSTELNQAIYYLIECAYPPDDNMNTKTPTDIVQWLAIHTFNEGGAINLDDLGEFDLMEFTNFDDNDEGARTKLANKLFPNGADAQRYRTAEILFRYARCKLRSMQSRRNGRIGEALTYEQYCDEYYRELPEFARW